MPRSRLDRGVHAFLSVRKDVDGRDIWAKTRFALLWAKTRFALLWAKTRFSLLPGHDEDLNAPAISADASPKTPSVPRYSPARRPSPSRRDIRAGRPSPVPARPPCPSGSPAWR